MKVAAITAMSLLACLLAGLGNAEVSKNPGDAKFYLYSDENTKTELIYGNDASLEAARAGKPTVLIIDGFLSDFTSPMSQTTKNQILEHFQDSNVIVVDWGKLSGSGVTIENQFQTATVYLKVLGNVGPVAQHIADFLESLRVHRNINFNQVHIVGHSLGAHMAGAAGYWVTNKYGGLIDRISGLDPAGPLFSGSTADKRLHKGDAAFVDIYHTNRGTLGDSSHQTGDINVYVNGGAAQPGCEAADKEGFKGYCSHSYSWLLWNHCSTSNSCYACPCSGYNCQCAGCSPSCSNGVTLGVNAPNTASGAFYLQSGPLE